MSDGTSINPVDIRVVRGLVEVSNGVARILVDVSEHGLVLFASPAGELVVASDVGRIAAVVLLNEGVDLGEAVQAHLELVEVGCLEAELGAVVHEVELHLVHGIGSGEDGGEGKGAHILIV